jgi:hypothetical protein
VVFEFNIALLVGAIAFIIRDIIFNKFNYGINLEIFGLYLAESLAVVVIFGLTTFTVKYFKFKKRNKVN